MGVVIHERRDAKGSTKFYVRWNRRRNDRPRSYHLGAWPEEKLAKMQRDRAYTMLAMTGTIDLEAIGRPTGMPAPVIDSRTIAVIAERWLKDQHVGWSAMSQKRAHAAKITERWPSRHPENVTQADVQAWINDLVAEGLSVGTIKNHLNSLRPMLRGAGVEPLWLRGFKALNLPTEAYEDLDLPDRDRREAVRVLLSAEHQAIFDCMEHGGLRTAEAVDLTWRQVGVGKLLKVGTKHVKKGGKPPRTVEWLPKMLSGSGTPQPNWIPVKPQDAKPEGRVFSGSARNFQDAVREACEDAGVEVFTPYDLRHLQATRSLHHVKADPSAQIPVMARRLGHDVAIFLTTYSDHELPDPD